MWKSPEIWGVAGAALGAVGVMIAGLIKSKGDVQVGLTKAQATMLTDAWAHIQVLGLEVDNLRGQLEEERRQCDERIKRLEAKMTGLEPDQ